MNGTSRIISLCQGLWPGQQASACPHSDAIEIVKSAALFSLMALLDNKTFIFTLSRIVCSVEVQCHSSYRKHFILSLLATSFGALVAATWHMRETAGDCMALCFPKPTVGDDGKRSSAGSCWHRSFGGGVWGGGGVFLLVYRLVESIYLLCLAVSRLKGV